MHRKCLDTEGDMTHPRALALGASLLLAVVGVAAWVLISARASAMQDEDGERTQVTVENVVDGDTIDVSPEVEGTERVRLIGVDTPEVSGGVEPCGPEASDFTEERLQAEQLELEFDEDRLDPYDRALAYVWLPGDELFNETLVREGLAEVTTFPPNVRYEDRFEEAQQEARGEGRGIWGEDGCAS